jgi:hypothetical protein
MTVRIGDAGPAHPRYARYEQALPGFAGDGGRVTRRSLFPRHRFVWRFSAQAAIPRPKG